MELLLVPFNILTVTTETFPLSPGWIAVTWVNSHFVGTMGSSRKHTMSPTLMLREGVCHFHRRCYSFKYSKDHRDQKCRTKVWHKRQCFKSDIDSFFIE